MYYIVFDLEFNQDLPSVQESSIPTDSSRSPEALNASAPKPPLADQNSSAVDASPAAGNTAPVEEKRMPYEILQIGALKLNRDFHTVDSFSRLVKPLLYPVVSPFITELTGITTDQVKDEAGFPEVYQDFIRFIGTDEAAFCVWGKTDVKELYRNVIYHNLDRTLLPKLYLNIQPYASEYLGFSKKKLLRLRHAAEALELPLSHSFHDAAGDAYYTAEILKKIYKPSMKLKAYDPIQTVSRPRPPKQIIDFDQLYKQFEKMYDREMTEEEKGMIRLAYHMGRTRQFIKEQ